MSQSALVFMWIENPAGAPHVPVPQTWSVMLDGVLLTQLMAGVVRAHLGGGAAMASPLVNTSAATASASDATESLCPCRIRPPLLWVCPTTIRKLGRNAKNTASHRRRKTLSVRDGTMPGLGAAHGAKELQWG